MYYDPCCAAAEDNRILIKLVIPERKRGEESSRK